MCTVASVARYCVLIVRSGPVCFVKQSGPPIFGWWSLGLRTELPISKETSGCLSEFKTAPGNDSQWACA